VIAVGELTLSAGAAFGIAAGIAFAAGDIATKATVAGDGVLVPAMVAAYGAGTLLLQMGFQRGSALVTAGLATLLTNCVPIAAGMTIFHEPLPEGVFGFLRVLAFIAVVASAVLLGRRDAGGSAQLDRSPAGSPPQHARDRSPAGSASQRDRSPAASASQHARAALVALDAARRAPD
jgi:hypothetical protein